MAHKFEFTWHQNTGVESIHIPAGLEPGTYAVAGTITLIEEELRPCPFCGCEAQVLTSRHEVFFWTR